MEYVLAIDITYFYSVHTHIVNILCKLRTSVENILRKLLKHPHFIPLSVVMPELIIPSSTPHFFPSPKSPVQIPCSFASCSITLNISLKPCSNAKVMWWQVCRSLSDIFVTIVVTINLSLFEYLTLHHMIFSYLGIT